MEPIRQRKTYKYDNDKSAATFFPLNIVRIESVQAYTQKRYVCVCVYVCAAAFGHNFQSLDDNVSTALSAK